MGIMSRGGVGMDMPDFGDGKVLSGLEDVLNYSWWNGSHRRTQRVD